MCSVGEAPGTWLGTTALFHYFCNLKKNKNKKHPPTAIIKLGMERTFFLYNSDWICLK